MRKKDITILDLYEEIAVNTRIPFITSERNLKIFEKIKLKVITNKKTTSKNVKK